MVPSVGKSQTHGRFWSKHACTIIRSSPHFEVRVPELATLDLPGHSQLRERLNDPETTARIREAVVQSSFGTFPRKIGRFAIEQEILSLPAAIRSATGLPAEILGPTDRGLLRPGMAADFAVFDPNTFRDRATFHQPYLTPSGIRYVLVNGMLAVYDGQATGTLSGRAIRNQSGK